MNSTFNNIALFIKRTEEYQSKEFIIQQFNNNNIGKVRDITFIKKQNDIGTTYNGVIVIFERWNMNKLVETLLSEMSSSPDGTTKFYFQHNRYWIIQVHKQHLPECEESTIVDASLTDKEKITQLEAIVKSMSAQICYLQTRQEKSERKMMENEQKETYHQLINIELKSKLEEKERDQIWEEEEHYREIESFKAENEMLRCRLTLNSIDLLGKEKECEYLRQETRDQENILEYINRQAREMKQMLRDSEYCETDIKEYLY